MAHASLLTKGHLSEGCVVDSITQALPKGMYRLGTAWQGTGCASRRLLKCPARTGFQIPAAWPVLAFVFAQLPKRALGSLEFKGLRQVPGAGCNPHLPPPTARVRARARM